MDTYMEQSRLRLVDFWLFLRSLSDLWLIILLLAVYAAWNDVQHQKRLALVEQPLVNDLYLVDFFQINNSSSAEFRYLLLKIIDIDSNHIDFVVSNYAHSKPIEVADIVKFDVSLLVYNYFDRNTYTVSHETLLSWADKEVIYDIERPDGLYINGSLVLRPAEAAEANEKNSLLLAQDYKIN
ncbi:hypothetical protein EYS14_21370 [Alteromonadaceae bacterium M269]|nr:hypothetical protein EYS14_21370 [Alteromonadaceae bacterium M269]